MKLFMAAVLLLAPLAHRVEAQTNAKQSRHATAHAATGFAEGILQSVANARVHAEGSAVALQRIDAGAPIRITFKDCDAVGIQREQGQWWVVPTSLAEAPVHANSSFWFLPTDPAATDKSWHMDLRGAEAVATKTGDGLTVEVQADTVTLSRAEVRPHSDPFGHRFALQMEGGAELEDALAAFYWGTMLPSVVEKTLAAKFPYSSGYVLSTLNVKAYAGSYPAVDHEFQIKGRLAMATDADLDVVRRMIELQFRLMNDDPEKLYRAPTSVQPNGTREYHIRRDSKDARENAAMFPLTGNIEVIEESWLYYQSRKDADWLQRNIDNLENAAGWTLESVDQYGRVWSDVYYEDQVIKDGRETEAQVFAANTFALLAKMETLLHRPEKAATYDGVSQKLVRALVSPLPMGYWDEEHHTFVDWVDRLGKPHGHVPLLANTLPVTFGYATPAQAAAVKTLVAANNAELERFPSFVSADVGAYTDSEMGVAGPYDLSAAGRYWSWDAAYREAQGQNDVLLQQLEAVAAEGRKSGYLMGERYDMDHVYYVDGKDAHGAEKYYEYPNVFAAVLINRYLGLTVAEGADLRVAPRLHGYGTVQMEAPLYAVRYTWNAAGFALENLADKPRRIAVDLSGLQLVRKGPDDGGTSGRFTVTLAPHEKALWIPAH